MVHRSSVTQGLLTGRTDAAEPYSIGVPVANRVRYIAAVPGLSVLLLGVNWLVVKLATDALVLDRERGIEVCRGTSAWGVTLSFLTPLLLLALAVVAVPIAIRELRRSAVSQMWKTATVVSHVAVILYAVGVLVGAFPRPPRHPCLRSSAASYETNEPVAVVSLSMRRVRNIRAHARRRPAVR
jgi:hypothetical protein